MALKIFKKETEPQCGLCEHGSVTPDGNTVICRKAGGIMQPFSKCRRFKYDPLKREPKTIRLSNEFTKDDFTL